MSINCDSFITLNSLLKIQIDEFLKCKFKEYGHEQLKPSYSKVLGAVYKHGDKMQIKCLYDSMKNQKSTITEMINRLVKLDYLQKVTCSNDKRVSYIIATEKALAFKEDFNKISQELINKIFSNFSSSEEKELISLITKALKNFD